MPLGSCLLHQDQSAEAGHCRVCILPGRGHPDPLLTRGISRSAAGRNLGGLFEAQLRTIPRSAERLHPQVTA